MARQKTASATTAASPKRRILRADRSTTAATAIGKYKILIAVAAPSGEAGKDATYQVFGGAGGVGVFITADNIAANTITANEITANTITAAEIAADTITAAEIAAATITGARTS